MRAFEELDRVGDCRVGHEQYGDEGGEQDDQSEDEKPDSGQAKPVRLPESDGHGEHAGRCGPERRTADRRSHVGCATLSGWLASLAAKRRSPFIISG